LSYVANGVVSIVLAIAGFGVWALVGGQVAYTASRSICVLIIQPHSKRLQLKAQAFKDLAFFGGGITIVRVFDWCALQGDKMVVGRWLGAEALGLYGRAHYLTVTPSAELGKIAERVLFPAMASVQNEGLRLKTAFLRGSGLMALLIVPLTTALWILGPEMVYIVLGPDWSAAVGPFRILALGMFFRAGYKIADTLARSKGAVYELAWRHAVYAAVVVTGAWVAHPFGLEAVALAIVLSLAIHFLLMTHLSLRVTQTTWVEFAGVHAPAAMLAAITSVIVFAVATVARHYGMPAIGVSLSALAVAFLCALVFSRLMPSRVLGRDGAWLLEAISRGRG
jgi:O-antigen/teichoic acid export membrane protein